MEEIDRDVRESALFALWSRLYCGVVTCYYSSKCVLFFNNFLSVLFSFFDNHVSFLQRKMGMQKLLSIVHVVLCGAAAIALGKSNVTRAEWL